MVARQGFWGDRSKSRLKRAYRLRRNHRGCLPAPIRHPMAHPSRHPSHGIPWRIPSGLMQTEVGCSTDCVMWKEKEGGSGCEQRGIGVQNVLGSGDRLVLKCAQNTHVERPLMGASDQVKLGRIRVAGFFPLWLAAPCPGRHATGCHHMTGTHSSLRAFLKNLQQQRWSQRDSVLTTREDWDTATSFHPPDTSTARKSSTPVHIPTSAISAAKQIHASISD